MSEIIEDESGKHHGEPRQLDREAAEMAHIGVERLAAGDGERDSPEHDKAGGRSGDKDADCMRGVQCRKHTRGCGDLKHSDYRDDGEPQDHHRAEEAADAFGAALLKEEKCEQHRHRQRQDEAVQRRRRNANALDSAETRRLLA